MAELNAGVNLFQVDQAGANGKIAFTIDTPNSAGFAESTHHFAKTADDMGIFVYTDGATSIKIWQKINGSWVDCGSTGNQLIFPWAGSFAWRDRATHMHIQLDAPSDGSEKIRLIKIEGNMFASFDGTLANQVLLLNDSVVEDTDDDGDIEVTSGTGYVRTLLTKPNVMDGEFTFTSQFEVAKGVVIFDDVNVLSFEESLAWDGTKQGFTVTVPEGLNMKSGRTYFYALEPQAYSGNVSDGAISGATVTDVATGETATTDANGDFTFANKPAGAIEAEGGVDVVTGDAYVGKMKGNSKYTIISPLSTAAVEVAEDQGISFDQAVDDILDNSAVLFGIDFPKEDKLELLNKRFVDEAAKGNSKAVRGSALIAMIDASAEIVGESLTHMRDGVAGDLATDAVDGKRQAYKGIARLVQDAKALSDVEREDLARPIAIEVERVSNAVAIRKGAVAAEVELKNKREDSYITGITDLLQSRSEEMSEALSSKYDENYAITRIQSIAKTAKNEDKTALEGFKGQAGEELTVAVVDNSKLNQIGEVPNKVVEEVKYSHTAIEEFDELSFTYGDLTLDVKQHALQQNNIDAQYTYFKELTTGTQLYFGDKGNDNRELDLLRLDDTYDTDKLKVPMTKAKIMTFKIGRFTYTVNFSGVVISIEEAKEVKSTHPIVGYKYLGGHFSEKGDEKGDSAYTPPTAGMDNLLADSKNTATKEPISEGDTGTVKEPIDGVKDPGVELDFYQNLAKTLADADTAFEVNKDGGLVATGAKGEQVLVALNEKGQWEMSITLDGKEVQEAIVAEGDFAIVEVDTPSQNSYDAIYKISFNAFEIYAVPEDFYKTIGGEEPGDGSEHIRTSGSYTVEISDGVKSEVNANTSVISDLGGNPNKLILGTGKEGDVSSFEKTGEKSWRLNLMGIGYLLTGEFESFYDGGDGSEIFKSTFEITGEVDKVTGLPLNPVDMVIVITWTPDTDGNGEEPGTGGDKLTTWEGAKIYQYDGQLDSWREGAYTIAATGATKYSERGKEYALELEQKDLRTEAFYRLYDGDMDNVYETLSPDKGEGTIAIEWQKGEALFDMTLEYQLVQLKITAGGEEPGTGDGVNHITKEGSYEVRISGDGEIITSNTVTLNELGTYYLGWGTGRNQDQFGNPQYSNQFRKNTQNPAGNEWALQYENLGIKLTGEFGKPGDDGTEIFKSPFEIPRGLDKETGLELDPLRMTFMVTWTPDSGSGDGAGDGVKDPGTETHLFESGGLYSVEYSNNMGGSASWPTPFDAGRPQPTVTDGILSFGGHRLRMHSTKQGAVEFSHYSWEKYASIDEWIGNDGFVDNVLTIRDLDIGKATETFVITWTPDSGSGDGNVEKP